MNKWQLPKTSLRGWIQEQFFNLVKLGTLLKTKILDSVSQPNLKPDPYFPYPRLLYDFEDNFCNVKMVKLLRCIDNNLIKIVECTSRQNFFDVRFKNFDANRFLVYISANQIFNAIDLIGCVSWNWMMRQLTGLIFTLVTEPWLLLKE